MIHLERQGVPRRPSGRKLTDEDVERAAALYEAGGSLVAVGKSLGVDGATIMREFLRAGIRTRTLRDR